MQSIIDRIVENLKKELAEFFSEIVGLSNIYYTGLNEILEDLSR